MQLIYLFTIAILNSIDNMGIGISYSVAGIKVKLSKNILIAFLAFGVSYITSLFGGIISHYLSDTTCGIISMLLLVTMGTLMIFKALHKSEDTTAVKLKVLDYNGAISVGIALAVDDIGSSVSSALIGYNPLIISLPYFIISLFIFFFGNYTSKFFSKFNKDNKATVIAGFIMIFLGIHQLFG